MTISPHVRGLDGRRRRARSRGTGRRLVALAAAAGAGAVLLAGCSDASETTCGEFLDQSTNDQKSTTQKLLEDRGTENPPAMLLAAAQGSLAGYCNVEGDDAALGDAMDAFSETLDEIGATTAPEQPGD